MPAQLEQRRGGGWKCRSEKCGSS